MILHRRTTKEGKAKLKIVLAGQRVERCGICLAQFKSGERGAFTDCSHTWVSAAQNPSHLTPTNIGFMSLVSGGGSPSQ